LLSLVWILGGVRGEDVAPGCWWEAYCAVVHFVLSGGCCWGGRGSIMFGVLEDGMWSEVEVEVDSMLI
jgi:hypothetical protein